MKKMILLLIFPLTALMAIDFTMTKEGLYTNTATPPPASNTIGQTTVDESNNPHLEAVEIPTYDSDNPEHVLITTSNGNWSEAVLNNASYTNFYIEPGDYTNDSISNQHTITRSGTANKRRTLSLYNGNNTHPGKLSTNELAIYSFRMENADYWTFDRGAVVDVRYSEYMWFIDRYSSNNIFNRMFASNSYAAFIIRDEAHNNTIQNSRLTNMTQTAFGDDVAMINIMDWSEPFVVYNTKIVGNEFVDCKPGRVNRYPGDQAKYGQHANFDGTIFAYNNVEYTTAKRTDGNGNYTPTGDYYAGECTGFGTKSGSSDANNPIILEHNHIWGMRPADQTFGDLSNRGSGFTVYMGSYHVKIRNNYIFDGTDGLYIADRWDEKYGTDYFEATNNTIVNCGVRPGASSSRSIGIYQGQNFTVTNNLVKDSLNNWAKLEWNYSGGYFGNNDAINVGADIQLANNAQIDGLNTNSVYATSADGDYTEDYTFTTDKFTNNPRDITLKGVLKTN